MFKNTIPYLQKALDDCKKMPSIYKAQIEELTLAISILTQVKKGGASTYCKQDHEEGIQVIINLE